MIPHETNTNPRYEAIGCVLGQFLAAGLLIVSLLTLAGSTFLITLMLQWMRLSDEAVSVLGTLWLCSTLGMVAGAAVLGGSMVYERLMRRWFEE